MNLRVLRKHDLDAFQWLPEVARTMQASCWADADAIPEAIGNVNVYTNSDTSVLIEIRPGFPTVRSATVRFLAVAPAVRRLGIGGRTAFAIEKRLAKTADAVFVQVPSSIGLALYFWLRLGYRPLTKLEWPSSPLNTDVCAWMKRDLR